MKKNWMLLIAGICLMIFGACDAWLDVKPKKTVSEEELFEREMGFKEALTAAYIKMAGTDLYAKELSFGFMDILGQRYSNAIASVFQNDLYYTFPSEKTEGTTNTIWKNMYNIIADLNNMLYWMDKNKNVFSTSGYYEIIKGETLGLRAFLHFDLLRMFGPIYKEHPESASICYRTIFSREASKILPAHVVADSIINDLLKAESLLAQVDPLTFDFPKTQAEEDQIEGDRFLIYRHKRMNLYAVKAMLARVYLFVNDKEKAMKYANEVIDSQKFRLVSDNSLDRIYSTEIIFSVYVDQFAEQVNNLFINGIYSIAKQSFLEEIFDVANEGSNDIRLREGGGFDYNYPGCATRKYRQENIWVSIEGTIPLIRLPEMYYILAECEENKVTSADYLNAVREARGIDGISYSSYSEKLAEIEKEYRKEFYGEGQLFYFYKRNFFPTFLHCPVSPYMTEVNYQFSLPENEILFGKVN